MSERIEKYFENPQTRVRRIVLFAIVSVFLSRGIIFLMYEIYASVYSESAGTWLQELNTWDTGWYRKQRILCGCRSRKESGKLGVLPSASSDCAGHSSAYRPGSNTDCNNHEYDSADWYCNDCLRLYL